MTRVWISIPDLTKKCQGFIKNNPELKLSKVVFRRGSFVFYREYQYDSGEKREFSDFRISLVETKKEGVGWCVGYMRHTGKWHDLPIFGSFDYCLKEIKSGEWAVLNPH